MKKSVRLFTIIFILAVGIIFLHTHIASAQNDIADPDSFFDVFFDITAEELGMSLKVEDPVVMDAIFNEKAFNLSDEMNANRLEHDRVQEIIRESGLWNQLGEADIVLPDGTNAVMDLTPGAVVWKWKKQSKACSGPHKFNIKTKAKVNQWIQVTVGKTNIAWRVFKPGRYYTDCMYINIHSNGTLTAQLENLGPLKDAAGNEISTAYAITDYLNTGDNEVFLTDPIPSMVAPIIPWVEDQATGEATGLPQHVFYKIWNRIFVNANLPPGGYTTQDASAIITIMADV